MPHQYGQDIPLGSFLKFNMKNDSKRMYEVLWEQEGEEPRGRVMEDTQRKTFRQHLRRSRRGLPGKDGRVPRREHRIHRSKVWSLEGEAGRVLGASSVK